MIALAGADGWRPRDDLIADGRGTGTRAARLRHEDRKAEAQLTRASEIENSRRGRLDASHAISSPVPAALDYRRDERPLVQMLLAWVMRKFKRFKAHKIRTSCFLQKLAQENAGLFVHWQLGMTGTFSDGSGVRRESRAQSFGARRRRATASIISKPPKAINPKPANKSDTPPWGCACKVRSAPEKPSASREFAS